MTLRWIPVSEKLPEDYQRVAVSIFTPHRGAQVRSGTYYENHFSNDNGDVWKTTDKEVRAWMPLPEPYKED